MIELTDQGTLVTEEENTNIRMQWLQIAGKISASAENIHVGSSAEAFQAGAFAVEQYPNTLRRLAQS